MRNGFYYAAAVVVLVMVLVMRQLPAEARSQGLPLLIYGNLLMNGFFFVAGQVLLEKGEGTLEAQVVTPLRATEYLVSKVVSLTALTLLESVLIALLAVGMGIGWPGLLAGVALLTPLLVLTGFLLVSRYDTINEFLFPATLAVTALSLPLLASGGLLGDTFSRFWTYLMPVEPAWLLLRAAIAPVAGWQVLFGVLAAVAWLALAALLAQRAFHRFVAARQVTR